MNNGWGSSNDSWRNKSRDSNQSFSSKDYGRNRRPNPTRRSEWGLEPITTINEPVPFTKDFYTESTAVKKLLPSEITNFRKTNSITIKGDDVPNPILNFEDANFPKKVLEIFAKKNYTKPSSIQAQGWPMALKGRDMVGIAQTGSGKTISFALPALVHASNQTKLRKNDGPIVLVLAPTRELCLQILNEFESYSSIFNLNCVAVYGGVSAENQKKTILNGVEILIATPGRLIDLHDQGFCPLNRVTFLVLDEADRMLDMGFEPQLRQIVPKTNPNRQTLMWSATWPKEVYNLAVSYLKKYIQVNIGSEELSSNKNILQKVLLVSNFEKKDFLIKDLENNEKIIIFVNMKRTADELEFYLREKKRKCAAIHGDKSQAIRDRVIDDFRSGRNLILIATDVAARGLDVKDVKLVINYDFPNNTEDYVHRIGRTGRAGESGISITYFTKADSGNARDLVKVLKEANQQVPYELEQLGEYRRAPVRSYRRY